MNDQSRVRCSKCPGKCTCNDYYHPNQSFPNHSNHITLKQPFLQEGGFNMNNFNDTPLIIPKEKNERNGLPTNYNNNRLNYKNKIDLMINDALLNQNQMGNHMNNNNNNKELKNFEISQLFDDKQPHNISNAPFMMNDINNNNYKRENNYLSPAPIMNNLDLMMNSFPYNQNDFNDNCNNPHGLPSFMTNSNIEPERPSMYNDPYFCLQNNRFPSCPINYYDDNDMSSAQFFNISSNEELNLSFQTTINSLNNIINDFLLILYFIKKESLIQYDNINFNYFEVQLNDKYQKAQIYMNRLTIMFNTFKMNNNKIRELIENEEAELYKMKNTVQINRLLDLKEKLRYEQKTNEDIHKNLNDQLAKVVPLYFRACENIQNHKMILDKYPYPF